MKRTYSILVVLAAALFIANTSCADKSIGKTTFQKYSLKPKGDLIIYGINIPKIMDKPFKEIEKQLGAMVQVDREVAVVFIRRQEDLVFKSHPTVTKDSIDIVYGPIEDLAIYGRFKKMTPNSMILYGSLKMNEKSEIKKTIIAELEKNLEMNDATKRVLEQISNEFITGSKRKVIITINFVMPGFPIASFDIGFAKAHPDEIFYKYVFSEKESLYP
jgi:hypothetical protein